MCKLALSTHTIFERENKVYFDFSFDEIAGADICQYLTATNDFLTMKLLYSIRSLCIPYLTLSCQRLLHTIIYLQAYFLYGLIGDSATMTLGWT